MEFTYNLVKNLKLQIGIFLIISNMHIVIKILKFLRLYHKYCFIKKYNLFKIMLLSNLKY